MGYVYVTGRNRVGFTSGIQKINQMFGAYTVGVYSNQYGGPGQALYYRIPILRPAVPVSPSFYENLSPNPSPATGERDKSLSTWWRGCHAQHGGRGFCAIQAPLGSNSPEILEDIKRGKFTSAVGTKLTLSNWATPDMIRYTELLKQVMPKVCKHLYFTSGRDEIVDKGLRCLRVIRPKAEIMIGLRGQYLGHTTAAARSLTDPEYFKKPFGWFNWPLVNSIEEIQAEIKKHSPEKIFGIVVELIGEKTGRVILPEFLEQLNLIRTQTAIPLIFVETASGLGRNGDSLFMSDSLAVQPNMVWWYSGGQLGHVFVDDAHYVSKPLTLISTWDGDEISMRRNYRHILVALESLKNQTALYFEAECKKRGSSGKGFWQVLKGVMICPPINITREQIDAGLSHA